MYLQYVQSCRFTTASTLGCICFMRLSLSELYSLDEALAYQHAFLYIRQMNFLLRNAIIASQDVSYSAVAWLTGLCFSIVILFS